MTTSPNRCQLIWKGAVGFLLPAIALLFAPVVLPQPSDIWESIRVGQYDWICETVAGEFVSGHQRQDKALQSCSNAAIHAVVNDTGVEYQVRPAVYRIRVFADAVAQTIIGGGVPGGSDEVAAEPSANTAPVWAAPATYSIPIDESYSLDLTTLCSDAEMDSLSFSASGLPTGVSLSTNTLTGTPTGAGDYNVTLGCNDGGAAIIAADLSTTVAFDDSIQFTPAQADTVTVEYEITPVAGTLNLVTGLGESIANGYNDILAIVRLNTSGEYDCRNAGTYEADATIAYAAEVVDTIKIVADIPAGTFDAFIDDAALCDDYEFRGSAFPDDLGYFSHVDSGAYPAGSGISNVRITQPVEAKITYTVFGTDMEAPDAPSAPTEISTTSTMVSMSLPGSMAADHSHYDLYSSLDDMSYSLEDSGITTANHSVTGLSPETSYWFALVDVDLSGNESAQGSSLMVTTPETPPPGDLSIDNEIISEGDSGTSNITFTLTLAMAVGQDTVFTCHTLDNTAQGSTTNADYTPVFETVTIPGGMTETTVVVPVNGDTDSESTESFFLRCY